MHAYMGVQSPDRLVVCSVLCYQRDHAGSFSTLPQASTPFHLACSRVVGAAKSPSSSKYLTWIRNLISSSYKFTGDPKRSMPVETVGRIYQPTDLQHHRIRILAEYRGDPQRQSLTYGAAETIPSRKAFNHISQLVRKPCTLNSKP